MIMHQPEIFNYWASFLQLSLILAESICPSDPHTIPPLLNDFHALFLRHPLCCVLLQGHFVFSPLFVPQTLEHPRRPPRVSCTVQRSAGFSDNSPRWGPTSPLTIHVSLDSGLNPLCLSFFICKLRMIMSKPTKPWWELCKQVLKIT